VSRFAVAPTADPGVYAAEVTCSAGTYVRVLADDLGRLLGGGAHLRALRRTAVGPFSVAESRRVADLDRSAILPPAEAVRHLDRVTVDAEVARFIGRGLPLDRVPVGASGEGPWALCDPDGRLLAVYEATGTDRIKAAVVLVPEGAETVGDDRVGE
jgi:tRNA pseudouridine55 synthase